MELWVIPVYKALICASIIAILMSFSTTGNVSFGATISGYCLLILFIGLMLVVLLKNIAKNNVNTSFFHTLLSIIGTLGPFLLLLGVIGFLMYLNIFYMTPIINNQVSQGYHSFNKISLALILAQIFIVYQNIDSESFKTTNKVSKITFSLMYLFGILTLICSLDLYTILKYFRTDG